MCRTMRGQLVGRSERIKYLSSTTYVCGNSACSQLSEDAAVYVRVRGLADKGAGREEQEEECHLCGRQLQEQFSKRDISIKVSSEMFLTISLYPRYRIRIKFFIFVKHWFHLAY